MSAWLAFDGWSLDWALRILLKPFTVKTEEARAASEALSAAADVYLLNACNTDVIGRYDIVNNGWHIFLNRFVTYAALANAS